MPPSQAVRASLNLRLLLRPDAFAGVDDIIRALVRPSRGDTQRYDVVVRRGFAANFFREGGPNAAWTPLARSTRFERRKLGFPPSNPILKRTGSYMSTWINTNNPNARSEIEQRAYGFSLYIGSRDYRVRYLEGGRRTTRRPAIPPRPVRFIDDGYIRTLQGTIDLVARDVVKRIMR